jgi:hypothetical protein
MLQAGPLFWQQAGFRFGDYERLHAVVRAYRETESAFCAALTARLEAMVRFHAADREAWDFLAQERQRLKPANNSASKNKTAPISVQDHTQRLQALDAIAKARREPCGTATTESGLSSAKAARKLCTKLSLAAAALEHCRVGLRRAARDRADTLRRLNPEIERIGTEFRLGLRTSNPRWLLDAPAAEQLTFDFIPSPRPRSTLVQPAAQPLTVDRNAQPAHRLPRVRFTGRNGRSQVLERQRPASKSTPPVGKGMHAAQHLSLVSALAWLLPLRGR